VTGLGLEWETGDWPKPIGHGKERSIQTLNKKKNDNQDRLPQAGLQAETKKNPGSSGCRGPTVGGERSGVWGL